MIERIERIAVLGSGRMASGIATLFANAGIPTLVFDLRQEALEAQMADLKNQQGDLYLQTEDSALITPCNYQDHLGRLHETDWVIEAVTDDATVKKGLFFKILPFLNPGTFLSSTSAFLSHSSLCEGMPSEFCDYFVLTQFHFPPEQSNLLELVTGEDSLPEVAATLSHFCRTVLGREVVTTSDTPGLILNRLRTFDILNTFVAARDHEISLATADYLTGAFLGRPEGVFSHADRIGIDFVALSALHFLEKCVNDPNRNAFRLPDALLWLVDKENFGRKSGRGFFGVEENLQFDPQELKYVPRPANPEGQTGILPYLQSIPDRLRSLATGNSREAAFLWQALSRLLLYAANQIPDNAATLVETDRVMRYGLSWPHGPFELWDILGLENTLQRMGQDGLSIPAWLEAMPEGGHRHFYSTRQQEPHFFDVHYGEPSPILHDPGHISLSRIRQRPAVYENWNASLHEVGEGLLCLVMHPITGPPAGMLDPAVLEVAEAALNIIPKEGYRGLLLTTDGEDFSNGAYHEMLLQFCRSERWEDLELWSRQFQEITQQLRYAPFPVVAAVSGRLIGPGLELAMACDKVVAHGHLQAGFEGLRCGLSPFG
nr:3-hydroxyacyl-CoA dehydrogenase NAD-binding domain-containing protein [Calditrichia bacterium]